VGHRKVWALARHQGHAVTTSTVLRILDDAGLVLKASYQRERRELAKTRKAAFAEVPTAPNQVWQLDFSEYETTSGGTWRVAGVADYYSKYEFGWRWSPTANQHDAIAALEVAIVEAEHLAGTRLLDAVVIGVPLRTSGAAEGSVGAVGVRTPLWS
jgi:transposase InsO family protein